VAGLDTSNKASYSGTSSAAIRHTRQSPTDDLWQAQALKSKPGDAAKLLWAAFLPGAERI
jgi:hypothetical protein